MVMIAALTGATGFVGQRLVGTLGDRGFRVRALVRRGWPGEPIELVAGDLADSDALARLADGAEVVIHLAGAVKARNRREFFETNGCGSRRVAEAVAQAGGRGILVSSLVAREPSLSDYAASKAAGEAAAREALGERLTIVRPSAVYGPGDRATVDLFRAAAKSPVLPIPDLPRARVALAYVDDVCAAIADLALAASRPEPIEIGGARPAGYSWPEIVAALRRAADRSPSVLRVPGWALMTAGAIAGGAARLTGSASMLTIGKAREILHPDWSVALGSESPTGNRTATDLDTGFSRTLGWYREHGWIL